MTIRRLYVTYRLFSAHIKWPWWITFGPRKVIKYARWCYQYAGEQVKEK